MPACLDTTDHLLQARNSECWYLRIGESDSWEIEPGRQEPIAPSVVTGSLALNNRMPVDAIRFHAHVHLWQVDVNHGPIEWHLKSRSVASVPEKALKGELRL